MFLIHDYIEYYDISTIIIMIVLRKKKLLSFIVYVIRYSLIENFVIFIQSIAINSVKGSGPSPKKKTIYFICREKSFSRL